ncbi:putative retrotransposon hot spot protein (RHS) [Trypanosoma cruzi]|uniref:Putative retrotransposon hot spot protein (RHS) n=1 Tax=Trypanosoma cruzi TaxID=5693 RepID=A0A2V2VEQ8_TRYCR|nr:putative retrotransposon hot spot protein (RHS) [Trypanosoma cruzi]RNC41776.1 retrotransposon hot spot (RHS) protein [Trypanosoma cruzi]
MEYRTNTNIKHRLLCIPAVGAFLLVDGFFFVESNPRTLVGLRMATTAGGCHTTASTVRQFTVCPAAYFNGWEELSRDMSWEMIYVQHENSTMITNWQRCGPVNTENLSDAEKEIVAFWDGKVHQYQVILEGKFPEEIKFSHDGLPEGYKKSKKI